MSRKLFLSMSLSLVAAMLIAASSFPGAARAAARVGSKAPAFSVTDSQGKTHKLSDYKGKYVVLEWFNHGCPFVRKHYGSGNMQALQKKWTAKDVVWLAVNSGAKNKQGFEDAEKTNETAKEKGTAATAILLDTSGKMGKAFGATATPHMFVIDPKGKVIYAGAIDSIASTEQDDIAKATNYVDEALQAALAGEPVKTPQSQAYGCGVKYE